MVSDFLFTVKALSLEKNNSALHKKSWERRMNIWINCINVCTFSPPDMPIYKKEKSFTFIWPTVGGGVALRGVMTSTTKAVKNKAQKCWWKEKNQKWKESISGHLPMQTTQLHQETRGVLPWLRGKCVSWRGRRPLSFVSLSAVGYINLLLVLVKEDLHSLTVGDT